MNDSIHYPREAAMKFVQDSPDRKFVIVGTADDIAWFCLTFGPDAHLERTGAQTFAADLIDFIEGRRKYLILHMVLGITGYTLSGQPNIALVSLSELSGEQAAQFSWRTRLDKDVAKFIPVTPHKNRQRHERLLPQTYMRDAVVPQTADGGIVAHHLGDRVSRYIDTYDASKGLKHGTVLARYSHRSKPILTYLDDHSDPVESLPSFWYPEMYIVQWDDGTVERGFLPHGLIKEGTCEH